MVGQWGSAPKSKKLDCSAKRMVGEQFLPGVLVVVKNEDSGKKSGWLFPETFKQGVFAAFFSWKAEIREYVKRRPSRFGKVL